MTNHKPFIWKSTGVASTTQFAERVAQFLPHSIIVYLSGDLGAGKTLWVRSLLRACGERDTIPSPSYALAYTYIVNNKTFHHFDFYRLQNAPAGDDLLELMDDTSALCFIEWPEMAIDLNPPDIWLKWTMFDDDNRQINCQAHTEKGQLLCQQVFAL